jgi:beta-lactamase regulating signal transducer with metallopeptidase domain
VIAWAIQNMLWASLAALVVLALRRPVALGLGAAAAYALWLVPAARLLMPPLEILPPVPASLLPMDLVVGIGEGSAASAPPTGGPGQWVPVLLAIWAGGAALFFFRQVREYREFLGDLSRSVRAKGAYRDIPLVESTRVDGPLAVGLLDRRIVVPEDFERRYTPGERHLALAHEYVHHRRGDIWWNLLALMLLALNWFNPVAWIAFRAFRADQELACDAAVAASANPAERHDYGRALVKSASRLGLISACPLNHADQLKRRLKMLNHHRTSPTRRFGGIAAVALLGVSALALGGPGVAQGTEVAEKRQRILVIERHEGEGSEQREVVRLRRGEGGEEHGMLRLRRGEDGRLVGPEGCPEGDRVANISEGGENDRTRILLCARGDAADPARRIEMLERARARIAGNDDLSAERRERVLAVLDREIARLRAD